MLKGLPMGHQFKKADLSIYGHAMFSSVVLIQKILKRNVQEEKNGYQNRTRK